MAFGGKPAWDKRAFPETPVTPSATLVSAVRPSLRDKSVPEVKKRKESEGGGGERRAGDALVISSHPSLLYLRWPYFSVWQGLQTDR